MNTVEQLDEALERIDLVLGNDPDAGWSLLEERAAVELLDQLTNANRKALLHVAAVSKSPNIDLDVDFIVAVSRLHWADPKVVLYAWGWTPAPGTKINPQQTIALKMSQYLILYYEWEVEHGALAN